MIIRQLSTGRLRQHRKLSLRTVVKGGGAIRPPPRPQRFFACSVYNTSKFPQRTACISSLRLIQTYRYSTKTEPVEADENFDDLDSTLSTTTELTDNNNMRSSAKQARVNPEFYAIVKRSKWTDAMLYLILHHDEMTPKDRTLYYNFLLYFLMLFVFIIISRFIDTPTEFFASNRQVSVAERVWKEMKLRNIEQDTYSHSIRLSIYSRVYCSAPIIEKLWEEVKHANIELNSAIQASLGKILANNRDPQLTFKITTELSELVGGNLDVNFVHSLIKIHVLNLNETATLQYVDLLHKKNLLVDDGLSTAIRLYTTTCRTKQALNFFKRYSKYAGIRTAEELLKMYNMMGNYEEGLQFYRQHFAHLQPDDSFLSNLMLLMLNANPSNALDQMQNMQEQYPDKFGIQSWTTILRSCVFSGDVSRLIYLIRICPLKRQFSFKTFKTIFRTIAVHALSLHPNSKDIQRCANIAIRLKINACKKNLNSGNVSALLVDIFDYLGDTQGLMRHCFHPFVQQSHMENYLLKMSLLKYAVNIRIRQLASYTRTTPYLMSDDAASPTTPNIVITVPTPKFIQFFSRIKPEKQAKLHELEDYSNPQQSLHEICTKAMGLLNTGAVQRSDFICTHLVALAILEQDFEVLEQLTELWTSFYIPFVREHLFITMKFIATLGDVMLIQAMQQIMDNVSSASSLDCTLPADILGEALLTAATRRFNDMKNNNEINFASQPKLQSIPIELVNEANFIALNLLTSNLRCQHEAERPLFLTFERMMEKYASVGDYMTCQYLIQLATQQFHYDHDPKLWSILLDAFINSNELELAHRLYKALLTSGWEVLKDTDLAKKWASAWNQRGNFKRVAEVTNAYSYVGLNITIDEH